MPGDGPFGLEALQVADKEPPEVGAGRNRRPTDLGEIESAFSLQPGIKAIVVEKTVEPGVKRMSASGRQVAMCYPERLLFGFLALANGHKDSLSGYCFPHFTRSTVWLNYFVGERQSFSTE